MGIYYHINSMVNSSTPDNELSECDWMDDLGATDEPAVRWESDLQVYELNKRTLTVSQPDVPVQAPALFLTEQGKLYLRLDWGHYYVVSEKVSDDLCRQLLSLQAMELCLLGDSGKMSLGCRLYHVPKIPSLISNEVEPTPSTSSSKPDFEEFTGFARLRANLHIGDGKSVFEPNDSDNESEESLTDARLAKELDLDKLYKVDSTHYLAYYDGCVFLLGIFDEKKTWRATESLFLNTVPTWESGDLQHISPVYSLLGRRRDVERRLGGNVHAVLVLGEGCNVDNEGEMEEAWKQAGVHVCTFQPRFLSELPFLTCMLDSLAGEAELSAPATESALAAAGYKVLVYGDNREEVAQMRLNENLKLVLKQDSPIAENGPFSLWYTPGHLYLVRTLTDLQDWLADEDRFNGEDPLWFSESSHMVSPVYELRNMANRIAIVHGIKPHKILLVPHEISIINSEDMEAEWDSRSVFVAVEDDCPVPDGMKSLNDCIMACRADDELLTTQSPKELDELREWFEEQ